MRTVIAQGLLLAGLTLTACQKDDTPIAVDNGEGETEVVVVPEEDEA